MKTSTLSQLIVLGLSLCVSACETFDASMLKNLTEVAKVAADYKSDKAALKSGYAASNNSYAASTAGASAESRTTKVHNPSNDASGCVTNTINSTGSRSLNNLCGYTVEVVWKDNGSAKFNNTWTLGNGRSYPISKTSTQYAACKGANSVYSEPGSNSYKCP